MTHCSRILMLPKVMIRRKKNLKSQIFHQKKSESGFKFLIEIQDIWYCLLWGLDIWPLDAYLYSLGPNQPQKPSANVILCNKTFFLLFWSVHFPSFRSLKLFGKTYFKPLCLMKLVKLTLLHPQNTITILWNWLLLFKIERKRINFVILDN